MNSVKNFIRKNFTIVPNDLINNSDITDRARFLFVYMLCKPDDWEFYNYQLSKSLGYSIDTLRKYLNELQDWGWLTKVEQARKGGKFKGNTYTLNERPVLISPYRKNSDTVKNRHGKTPTHTNKELYKKRINRNKDFSFKEKKDLESSKRINVNPRKS